MAEITQNIQWTSSVKPTDWEGWAKSYFANVSSTPVLCKDGTTQNQSNSPNARILDACRNNGGRAVNQPTSNAQTVTEELQTKKQESILGKISGSYGQNLIIAVVLVAGYFAYKKFKK